MSSEGPRSQQRMEFQKEKRQSKCWPPHVLSVWVPGIPWNRYFEIFCVILKWDHPEDPNDIKSPQHVWTGKREAKETFFHSVFQTWCFFPSWKSAFFLRACFFLTINNAKPSCQKNVQMLNSCYYSHYYNSNFELCVFKL